MDWPLRFGIFLAPFHPVGQNPTLALHDDVADQIQRLVDQSGGFGTFLCMGHDWADRAATHKSYSLLAREVFPRFQDSARTTTVSRDWAVEHRPDFIGAAGAAVMSAIQQHHEEKAATAD